MEDLGRRYLELKNIKGKYTGAEYNETIDSEYGEKYKIMNELLKELGKQGTSIAKICPIMGPPDTLSSTLLDENYRPPLQDVYMIYTWRGFHDYIWFKLNEVESEVVESD